MSRVQPKGGSQVALRVEKAARELELQDSRRKTAPVRAEAGELEGRLGEARRRGVLAVALPPPDLPPKASFTL